MNEDGLIYFDVPEGLNEDVKEIFNKFNSSPTTIQQLKIISEIPDLITINDYIPRALVDKFFTDKLKHPIKNQIQNAFKKISNEKAVEIISEEIDKKIIKLDSIEERIHFINCLNEASQVFKIVFKAISHKPDLTLNFLTSMLTLSHNELKADASPFEKSSIANRIHTNVQVILCCVRNCLEHNEKYSLDNQLKEITNHCMELLTRDDILIDTKNVFGILIVMENNLRNESMYLDLIRDKNEDYTKRLCLISGASLVGRDDNVEEFCEILNDIYIKNSVDSQVVVGVSRVFMQIAKKLFGKIESAKIIINFSFSNIEHGVDLIRHQAKMCLKILLDLKDENITDIIFERIKTLSSVAFQAIVIQGILSALPIATILIKLPKLQEDFLKNLHKHKENILTCYEIMACRYYDEVKSFEMWHENLIQPIIYEINRNADGRDDLKQLLSLCIKKDVKAIEIILKDRDRYDISFILSCLIAAKKASLLKASNSNQETWRGVIKYDEIKNAMIDFNDNVRFAAFQLIAETKKSTEEFNREELECIFYFYEKNINIQNPTIRQSIVGTTKKIFERFQMVIQVNRRKKDEIKLNENIQTLLKFQEFAIENLLDGANFSRRMLSLKMLSSVLEVLNKNFDSQSQTFWNEEKFNAIFNVFYDNFESNKELALDIMTFVPRDFIKNSSKLTLEYLERLTTSIRASDSLVAAYLLQPSIKFSLFELPSESKIFPSSYAMLKWCESLLLRALEIAEKSIIISSGSYTLYGPMLSIKYIVNKLNLNEIKNCEKWREFFERLIKTCQKLTDVVAPIVNNSSPEGVYPEIEGNDFDSETMKILENTTPQMILVNAWRTIKEVSLFLGDISLRGSGIILNTNQMLEMADHFLRLMTKTKHRGAFEQAFYGYSQFCVALRLSKDPELHNLPDKILENLITSIAGNNEEEDDNNLGLEMKNLCATRRSAGLPFILQALITSEMKIARSNNFHFVMKNLLRFARFGTQLETRIHSLNIMRALFRCKDLNDGIMEYVSDAIQCALMAYNAESWTERNSSTLLFSALMIRIFGPQRTKSNEELSIRNKMSGKVFFLKFPDLHNFSKKLLQEAAEKVQRQKKNVKLHPLLLLLNRLYSHDEENSIKLTEFIPIVTSCSGCVELQTRILCAKFVANNMPPKSVAMAILNDIKSCRDDRNLTANAKHGKLLRILYLCREHVDEGESLKILKEMFEVFEGLRKLIICLDTILEIMVELFSKITKSIIFMDDLEKCLKFIENEDFKATPLLQKKIIALNLVKIKFDGNYDWLLNLNEQHFYELQEKLNCILLILDYDYGLQVMDDYEIDVKICEMVKNLSSTKIVKDSSLKKSLKQLIKCNDFSIVVRSFEILSYLEFEKGENVKEILESALSKPDDLQRAMLKYATMCLAHEETDLIDINWEFMNQESSYFIKFSILDLIEILMKKIQSIKITFHMTKAILNLLMDDDVDVRLKASKIISTITNNDQLYIASHAHQIFLKHLEKLLNKNDFMALMICLAGEDIEDYQQDENVDEFQVFERNETNTFKEGFLIKELCMSILRANKRDVDKLKVINACRVIGEKMLTECEIEKLF